jgi:hypothetical protein
MVNERMFAPLFRGRLRLSVGMGAHLISISLIEILTAIRTRTIELSNHRRQQEGIGSVAPADVYYERRDGIFQPREEQKRVTLEERFRYNRSRSQEINLGARSPKP